MYNTLTDDSPCILDMPLDDINLGMKVRIREESKEEKVKQKITQQTMLNSLFDSDTGESHIHSSELMDMVKEEYQVNLVEVASGNGSAHNVYNVDTGKYEIYLSAHANESSEHAHCDLSNSLIDTYEGVANKNEVVIPAYETLQDDSGNIVRTDDMSALVSVDNSNYSIWDTIFEKGMLIVRHSGHWKGAGCRFDSENYHKREARRMKAKHNKLLGLSVKHSASNNQPKDIRVKRLNADMKGNKSLRKIGLAAKRGKQWAIDELSKIGYNEFA